MSRNSWSNRHSWSDGVDVINRLRGSHYASQRASHEEQPHDGLPLIHKAPTRDIPSRPPRPPAPQRPSPTHQPQPHQLIAVCFNHMAGRHCEHCQQLDGTMYRQERQERSPDSDETLGPHRSVHAVIEDNDKPDDGGETGGEKGGSVGGPPPPVNVFDSRLRKLWLEVGVLWIRTTLILSVFILAVLSMYWGVLFHAEENLSSLDVFVVDFDGTQAPYTDVKPLVGPLITQTTEKMIHKGSGLHLGYITADPSLFNHDPMQVRQAVYDFKAWAAIVINANATGLLQQAVQQGNASYDPMGACQTIYVQARDQDTLSDYILPQIKALQTDMTSAFGEMWTRMTLQNTSIPVTNLEASPQALSPAIGFSTYNLRPFGPAVATPAVSIGLIYLIIIAFFSFSFFLPIYTKFVTPAGHPPVKYWKFVLIRWCGTVMAYFLLSLFYSFVSLAFQIPFSSPTAPDTEVAAGVNAYGKGTFVVYWMINFVGMNSLGLACENVAMVIGQPWTAMWLIFWVITNVATSFYSLDVSPKFYYWGYAWPMHNIVEASRSTLFDLHSRIGLNFGVLFTWCAINSILFPFACYFMRWKMMRGKKKESQGKRQ